MPVNVENKYVRSFQKGLSRVQRAAEKVLFEYSQPEKNAIAEAYRIKVLKNAPVFIQDHDLLVKFGLNNKETQSDTDKHLYEFLEGKAAEHVLLLEQCPPSLSGGLRRRLEMTVTAHRSGSPVTVSIAIDFQRSLNAVLCDSFGESGDAYEKANSINDHFAKLNHAVLMHGNG